jgi:ferredoxin
MKLRNLRTARIFISILFFTVTLILFLDITGLIQQNFSTEILFLQFIPSLIGFIGALGITSIGFIIIIFITLLFGRVYCSSVCPLGILQDLIIFAKRKIGKKSLKKQKFSYTKPFDKTRFVFLCAAFILLLFGIITGFSLLDPYSNFGRIITNLFKPVIIGLNNLLVLILELFNNYSIYPIEFKGINYFSFVFSVFVFGLILFMSINHGRLFCNSACPVGTLLGYISKLSFYKIKIDESTCKECGVCEKVCKANCIDLETNFVDETRCINCFNCLEVCPSAGITYQRKKAVKDLPSESKRDFIKNVTIFLLGANLISKAQEKIKVYKESTIPVIRKNGISPPGSISLEHFNDNCTACHLCVSACPTQVIQPSFLEYGLLGIMQPLMNYKIGFCNYDCVICGDVCPTGAITNQLLDNKKLIQLGVAKFVKENCIVYSQGTDCGACAEHCPTKAVKMVLDIEVNKKAPVINEEICIGCGACEYACPTKPYKSIYIESNSIHKLAQKPKEEELKEKVNLKEEFPF